MGISSFGGITQGYRIVELHTELHTFRIIILYTDIVTSTTGRRKADFLVIRTRTVQFIRNQVIFDSLTIVLNECDFREVR